MQVIVPISNKLQKHRYINSLKEEQSALPVSGVSEAHDPDFVCDEIFIFFIKLLVRLIWSNLKTHRD